MDNLDVAISVHFDFLFDADGSIRPLAAFVLFVVWLLICAWFFERKERQ